MLKVQLVEVKIFKRERPTLSNRTLPINHKYSSPAAPSLSVLFRFHRVACFSPHFLAFLFFKLDSDIICCFFFYNKHPLATANA